MVVAHDGFTVANYRSGRIAGNYNDNFANLNDIMIRDYNGTMVANYRSSYTWLPMPGNINIGGYTGITRMYAISK